MKKLLNSGCIFFWLLYLVHPVSAQNSNQMVIFVSIPPQKYFVERIGGDHVRVAVMVGPGQTPEIFEPSSRQMTSLAMADIYFRICVPFERAWMEVIAATNRSLKIAGCEGFLNDTVNGNHARNQEEELEIHDPHVWTSPLKAMEISRVVLDELIATDPDSTEYYTENYKQLITDLVALDASIRDRFANLRSRYLIVSHPSLGYFADAYGLDQITIERKGKEIQGKSLVDLIEFARSKEIHTIFVQRQYRHASAELLARETGGEVVEFDPLAENYIENLYSLANKIAGGSQD